MGVVIHHVLQRNNFVYPFVTGPAARVPDEWDPHPTVEKLEQRGLVQLDGLDPLAARAFRIGVQERMDRYPLYSDAMSALFDCSIDDVAYVCAPDATFGHALAMVVNRQSFGSEVLGEMLLSQNGEAHLGFLVHTTDPLLATPRHESFHMLTGTFARLPAVKEFLRRCVAHVLDNPEFTFESPSPEDRLILAEHLGAYGAQPNVTVEAPDDGIAQQLHPDDIFEEMGAEALLLAREHGIDSSPLARAWATAAEIVAGKDNPLAIKLNHEMFQRMSLYNYLKRTRPAAVRAALDRGWFSGVDYHGDMTPHPAADADLQWELDNPHEPPAWMIDQFRAANPDLDDRAGRHSLMHATIGELQVDFSWGGLDKFLYDPGLRLLKHDTHVDLGDAHLAKAFAQFTELVPGGCPPVVPSAVHGRVYMRHDGILGGLGNHFDVYRAPWSGPVSPEGTPWSATELARCDDLVARAKARIRDKLKPTVVLDHPDRGPVIDLDMLPQASLAAGNRGRRRTRTRRVGPPTTEVAATEAATPTVEDAPATTTPTTKPEIKKVSPGVDRGL
jgi:hypothetical protein